MFDATDFITLSDAARLAGISKRTLQKHMKSKTSPTYTRIGREVVFTLSEVLKWAAERYPAGKPRRGKRRT
jgi:excisionase family DNA binding protein